MPGNVQSSEPLVILCNHRSGSSLFASLLADAGLHLGDLMPPAASNPRGFFENREIVDINRGLLNERDRDWTCPPAYIDHRSVDLVPLREIGAQLRDAGKPWGFKDPRTLFTLPVWVAALGPCRLVGVHRNSESVARSLAARDELTLEQALAVARAYAQRLAEAHKQLQFPVVSFDDDPPVFLERVARVAELFGLDEFSSDILSRYDDQLVHHRPAVEPEHAADGYLAAAARIAIAGIDSRPFRAVARTWERLPSDLTESLPRHLGPRFAARRDDVVRQALRILPSVADVAVVGPDERIAEVRNVSVQTQSFGQFLSSGAQPVASRGRVSHVIAPTWFDDIPPGEVASMWERLALRIETPGIGALGGWMVESDTLPGSHVFQPADVRASRTSPPYLHHLDEVLTSMLGRGLYVAHVARQPSGRTDLFVTTDRSLQKDIVSGARVRLLLAESEQAIGRLTSDLQAARDARKKGEEWHKTESTKLRRTHDDALRKRDDALRLAREQLDQRQTELERHRNHIQDLQRRLQAVELAYKRLRSRRVVRTALRVAQPLVPVFRAARALRKRARR